jgi:hypothetical protein
MPVAAVAGLLVDPFRRGVLLKVCAVAPRQADAGYR